MNDVIVYIGLVLVWVSRIGILIRNISHYSKFVFFIILFVELIIYFIPYFFTKTLLPLYPLLGIYISTILWDSRRFNIDSFSWKSLIKGRFFYLVGTPCIVLGWTEKDIDLFWIVAELVVGVITAEFGYMECKRRNLFENQQYPRFSLAAVTATPLSMTEIRIQ